ncbi:DUF465 domain-containing protein [Xanthobacteraceae bacterium Astr-EGSB]|jgi:hypothetical protein|uniref:YdcH family protein n=1 Tax=Astrobacterium formosum TaxID=3069710 RepID=UPI0027B79AB9|nr:DUF465 domain-containing protein [Xanthobacteraceae bacterium Astr-EGSB]
MSIQAQLDELEQRHQALDHEIAEAQQTFGVDDLKLAELKRRKLQLKDEIARIKNQSVH